jgi:hypothetical protein
MIFASISVFEKLPHSARDSEPLELYCLHDAASLFHCIDGQNQIIIITLYNINQSKVLLKLVLC